MPVRSASELARLEEELDFYHKEAYNLMYPKSYREECIRNARKIERLLNG